MVELKRQSAKLIIFLLCAAQVRTEEWEIEYGDRLMGQRMQVALQKINDIHARLWKRQDEEKAQCDRLFQKFEQLEEQKFENRKKINDIFEGARNMKQQLQESYGNCLRNMTQNSQSQASLQSLLPSLKELIDREIRQADSLSDLIKIILKSATDMKKNTTAVKQPTKEQAPVNKTPPTFFSGCAGVMKPKERSGVYSIKIPGQNYPEFRAYCLRDPKGKGKPWMVIQRRDERLGNLLDFKRNWSQYKKGFGNLYKDHWLGLQHVFMLTNISSHQLWIKGINRKAQADDLYHDDFEIASEAENYKIISVGKPNEDHSFQNCVNTSFNTFDRGNKAVSQFSGGVGFWGPCWANFNRQLWIKGKLYIGLDFKDVHEIFVQIAIRPYP